MTGCVPSLASVRDPEPPLIRPIERRLDVSLLSGDETIATQTNILFRHHREDDLWYALEPIIFDEIPPGTLIDGVWVEDMGKMTTGFGLPFTARGPVSVGLTR